MLVEDDVELAGLITDYLVKSGFTVSSVGDGLIAIEAIKNQKPDLVVLDVMLPGCTGMDVCRDVRPYYSGPILMLTAVDDDIDQMLGLELGADDYVIKPVLPRLLLSRIRALLRRANSQSLLQSNAPRMVVAGPIEINTAARTVDVQGEKCELTSSEYELLLMLAQEVGSVVERNTIVNELRGFEYDGLDRSIDRRISRLRKKLQHLQHSNHGEEIIKTIRGKGYQLCVTDIKA